MPRRSGGLTRDEVVAAAVGVVEAEGAGALGWNRVARELDVKPPSLYHHVGGQDELRAAVATAGWRALGDALEARPADVASAQDDVRSLATSFRAFVHAHPHWYAVMSTTPVGDDPDFPAVSERILARFARALAPLGYTGDGLVHAVRTLRSALHGFVLLEASGQLKMSADVDETFAFLVGVLGRGLVGPAKHPGGSRGSE